MIATGISEIPIQTAAAGNKKHNPAPKSALKIDKVFKKYSEYSNESYKMFQEALCQAEVRVNCFGIMMVKSPKYRGEISIHKIENHIVRLIKSNESFSDSDSTHGRSITESVCRLNDWGKEILQNKGWLVNLIRRIILFFKNICKNSEYHRYCYSFEYNETAKLVQSIIGSLNEKDASRLYDAIIKRVLYCNLGLPQETLEQIHKRELEAINVVKEEYESIKNKCKNANFDYILYDLMLWQKKLPITNEKVAADGLF